MVQLQAELEQVRKVTARQERVITPASESGTATIVRRRLLERFDYSAAVAYRACYAELAERADIPDRLPRADHYEEVLKNYLFHPDLFTVLTPKTATIPQFQETRELALSVARHKPMFCGENESGCRGIESEAAVSDNLRPVSSGAAAEALAEDYARLLAIGVLLGDDESLGTLMQRCAVSEDRDNAAQATDP